MQDTNSTSSTIQDSDLISITNRNNGSTGYNLPDLKITRSWAPGETKKIPFGELKSFSWAPGGQYALRNLFIIENKDALEQLISNVEPEYFYTEDIIRTLLMTPYNYDEFADFLDFAPEGAIEIAKDIAVKEELPDTKKRDMLSVKTGLNINNAINVNKIMDAEDETKPAEKTRRVKKEETSKKEETPTSRTVPQQYKVISK
jgi:hypothetical protein